MDYWESIRVSYAAFEAGQKSGSSDVYLHEMPGARAHTHAPSLGGCSRALAPSRRVASYEQPPDPRAARSAWRVRDRNARA
jgi:hypothetical protein